MSFKHKKTMHISTIWRTDNSLTSQ